MHSLDSRPPDEAFWQAIQQVNYTPPRRAADALLDRYLSSESLTEQATIERALRRIPLAAWARGQKRLGGREEASVRLLQLFGRLLIDLAADNPQLITEIAPLLRDAPPRAARKLIIALGKLPASCATLIEPLLLERFAALTAPADLRAVVESLGKLGGEPSLAALRAAQARGPLPAILAQAMAQATLRIERGLCRSSLDGESLAVPIFADRMLPATVRLVLRCRAGLTAILVEELRDRGLLLQPPLAVCEPADAVPPRYAEPGRVILAWSRPLRELYAARTFSSLSFELALASGAAASSEALGQAVADGLSAAPVRQLLATLSAGPPRYRLQFADGGPQRALVQRIAAAVRRQAPELLNDPKESPWQVEIGSAPPSLELVPRRLIDPRFAYRRRDVPAASHPPLAAALARLCAAGYDDVVWDPFTGSGTELIEIALNSPGARIYGSDLDENAIAAAEENAAAAGIKNIRFSIGDGLSAAPKDVTRIVTNPPMGRRTRTGRLSEFLSAFVAHAARSLRSGGRLIWISPQPHLTADVAKSNGLRLLSARTVDLNGFFGSLEAWEK